MNLKDCLHFYKKVPIVIVESPGADPVSHYLEGIDWSNDKVIAERVSWDYNQIKPILRPFSSLTEEEKNQLVNFQSKQWMYLLELGIDLFGLIESGQAIDSTTLK